MSDPLKDPLTPAEERVAKDVERKMRPRPTRGRDVKKKKFYLLKVGIDEWYRLRRADLPTIFFEGLFPSSLLKAVDSLQDWRRKVANDQYEDAFTAATPDARKAFMEILRRAAVAVVVSPKLTFSKAESLRDPDALWVGGYSDLPEDVNAAQPKDEPGDVSMDTLMTVWRSVLGEAGIVVMPDDDALEFRPVESCVPDPPVLHGAGVRTEAVVVDSPELAHAGSVPNPARKVRFLSVE